MVLPGYQGLSIYHASLNFPPPCDTKTFNLAQKSLFWLQNTWRIFPWIVQEIVYTYYNQLAHRLLMFALLPPTTGVTRCVVVRQAGVLAVIVLPLQYLSTLLRLFRMGLDAIHATFALYTRIN